MKSLGTETDKERKWPGKSKFSISALYRINCDVPNGPTMFKANIRSTKWDLKESVIPHLQQSASVSIWCWMAFMISPSFVMIIQVTKGGGISIFQVSQQFCVSKKCFSQTCFCPAIFVMIQSVAISFLFLCFARRQARWWWVKVISLCLPASC